MSSRRRPLHKKAWYDGLTATEVAAERRWPHKRTRAGGKREIASQLLDADETVRRVRREPTAFVWSYETRWADAAAFECGYYADEIDEMSYGHPCDCCNRDDCYNDDLDGYPWFDRNDPCSRGWLAAWLQGRVDSPFDHDEQEYLEHCAENDLFEYEHDPENFPLLDPASWASASEALLDRIVERDRAGQRVAWTITQKVMRRTVARKFVAPIPDPR